MAQSERPLALVTGASTGIGYELARIAGENGFDLLICADEDEIEDAAEDFRLNGVTVEALKADLATIEGVEELYVAIGGRNVDALIANAGRGQGGAYLDQNFNDIIRVIDTNITGTIYLIQKIGRDMRKRDAGRILITGSIAGYIPGAFAAVYHGTKAFIDSFAYALRNELKDTNVSVTLLMPGATETEFFERAGMLDTAVGAGKKDNPAEVAEVGFKAMMDGDADIVSGWKNKLQTTLANVMPNEMLAEQNRKQSEPGSASN